ncbi:formylglycine-generating enzyme family protein [Niabella ginsengisoli]|uniref:SUMF1/EgtB/PvdO family nonheme iron enzyme n=1 Tax=Niabella ginsengisoli TaxID=522298 RepID=A0ABS9SLQ9_9BACT|nr:SUMF1/EgtB/PvdO family nonheme iron enzyme [Niabella ginsengisoli]MCH5599310.1 SUMF1/EgtB/PvdO family nonheme iron enzyme [Niabella ginsengisoli]
MIIELSKNITVLLLATLLMIQCKSKKTGGENEQVDATGMVLIPGGTFIMGSKNNDISQATAYKVKLDSFYMDATEVTNDEFARFVNETGYKTIAERPIDWDEIKKQLPPGTPKPDESMLQPGSLIFDPAKI